MSNIKRLHPGIHIKANLETMEMTAKEFSVRTGISERVLSPIINCKSSITLEIAFKLAQFFGSSVEFWMNLQNQYDLYMYELKRDEELKKELLLANKVKKYLLSIDAVSNRDANTEIVFKCKKLIGVNDLTLLEKKDPFACLKEQHSNKSVDYFMQNFWIALALNEARKKNGIPYNRKLLVDSIDEIRSMTTQDLDVFLPRLKEILSDCGISFVLLPYLTKSNIYGVTKWFSKDDVMLAISNRGGRADLFWFTLFHEISHVLMEHRRKALVNIEGKEDEEADKMAENMLIPKKEWDKFINENKFDKKSIINFANKINVLPCIVLGRLHKEKSDIVPYGKFDKSFNVLYKITNYIDVKQ